MLRPFLPRLVPILLRNMVYDDFDEEVADAEAAEVANSASDRDADIKPFIHRCAIYSAVRYHAHYWHQLTSPASHPSQS